MQKTRFRGFKLFHNHAAATGSMMRQIEEFPVFDLCGERPWVIDCGANIGITVFEWKTRWPQARIVCFEPDPTSFEILRRNIDANDIPGVECINAALADQAGTATLYGSFSANADTRGQSIDVHWGMRADGTQRSVRCVPLSDYLADREIGFLKMDIEGVEQSVLTEAFDHLSRVQTIHVEVHETRASRPYNSAAGVERLLLESGFVVEKTPRHPAHALPKHLADWQRRVEARQTQLIGWR